MTTETSTPNAEQQQEQQRHEAQEAESALTAGFNETRGNTPVEVPAAKKDEPKAETSTAPKADDKGSTTAASAAAVDPTKQATVAAEVDPRLRELFDKFPSLETRLNDEIRNLHGKFGDLNGRLQKLQPSQTQRKVEAAALKRLSQEFGPELAEAIAADLSEILSAAPAPATEEKPNANPTSGTDTTTAEDVQKRIDIAVAQVRGATEKRLLTVLHHDYEAIAKKPEFGEFMQSLPEADRNRYMHSDDAFVAAEAFTKFKAWKPATAQKTTTTKQARLENAITPTGDGSPPAATLDDEAAFVAGYKEARSGG